jgi:polysaccharide biosynthesis transport protein
MNAEFGPAGGNGRPEGASRPYAARIPRPDTASSFEPRSDVGTSPLRDYASTLRRWRGTVALVTLLMVALAAAYSYTRTPVYTATASVLVRPVQTSSEPARLTDIDAQTEMKIASSLAVADIAARNLGTRDARGLLGHVSASMTQGSQILTVGFTAAGPDVARAGAQAFATAYLRYRQQLTTDAIVQQQASILSRLTDTRQRINHTKDLLAQAPKGSNDEANLQSQLQLLTATQLNLENQLGAIPVGVDPGIVIDPANMPSAPSSPNHPFDVAAGLFVGLALGCALAFVRDQMHRRIDTPEEVEEVLGVAALASVPRLGFLGRRKASGLAIDRDSSGSAAHAYRSLRTSLLAARERSGVRTVLVTSAGADEGKTTTAANLAAALAEVGAGVVLVSADLRKPTLHRIFKLPEKPGLTEVLANGAKVSRALRKTAVKNLRVIPSGSVARTTDAANLLESPRMAAMLGELNDADWVIIDAPPVLGPTDAVILADLADAVLVVIDAGATRERNAAAACRHIVRAGGRILGVVINKADGFNQYQYDYPARPRFSFRKAPAARPSRSAPNGGTGGRRSQPGERPSASAPGPANAPRPGTPRDEG